ncbi:uncharacterized protein LOC121706062 isoform X1 [Alosa sapidissima]|uniref:uncharacterized protein LOC121706062 isoform X1 n=2 Tax=Alosa sapidissima TaxID=34773 RepID=UPI001C092C27|nr:uncharacterized protein LOC121706062 isoform X1 [Alosa sapidissima]
MNNSHSGASDWLTTLPSASDQLSPTRFTLTWRKRHVQEMATLRSRRRVVKPINEAKYFSSLSKDTKISTEAAPPVPNAAGTESDVNNTEQMTSDTEQQQTSLANLALEDSTEKISTEAAPPVPNAAGTESDVNNTEQKRARRPVETTPGASDDGDSALEGTSQALHKNTDGKERVHSRREVRTHSGKKRARRPVETTPGASDDVDSALEGTRPLAWEKDPRRKQKRPWSPMEIAAVMRHFRVHIAKGSLATIKECKLCKIAEHPALAKRSEQNLRDFVRNRGIVAKKSFKDIRPVF